MSKASEWVKERERAELICKGEILPPGFKVDCQTQPIAMVNTLGQLAFIGSRNLDPSEALGLARWILDTFGEEVGR